MIPKFIIPVLTIATLAFAGIAQGQCHNCGGFANRVFVQQSVLEFKSVLEAGTFEVHGNSSFGGSAMGHSQTHFYTFEQRGYSSAGTASTRRGPVQRVLDRKWIVTGKLLLP